MKRNENATLAAANETLVLESGLTVLLHPMPGYRSVFAIYGTRFGSIHRRFVLDGREVAVPEGIAHFLEHKMFESEDGDAFALYAKTGASANAYTSFDKTCYLFTATENVDASLDVLLQMVGKPYFTKETIAKEQGIIGQEIKMYDDSPEWRLMTGIFTCLYAAHPIRADIAGTVESIAEITPDMLYACTDAFYSPNNMVLSVAGNVTKEQVLAACARAGLTQSGNRHTVQRLYPAEGPLPAHKELTFSMPVARTCFGLGFKEEPIAFGDAKREIICDMLPDLICGGMTPLYRKLYDESLVNPEFDGEYLSVEGACCLLFTGETDKPALVRQLLLDEIARLRREGVDETVFNLIKNQMYGGMITDLENVDDTATSMAGAFMKGRTLQQEIDALAGLTKADVDAALQTMLLEEHSALVCITPDETTEE